MTLCSLLLSPSQSSLLLFSSLQNRSSLSFSALRSFPAISAAALSLHSAVAMVIVIILHVYIKYTAWGQIVLGSLAGFWPPQEVVPARCSKSVCDQSAREEIGVGP